MTKTISKIGNSQGISLDKALLDQLGLNVGSKVHLTLSGRSIVLTPAEGTLPDKAFQDSQEKVNKKYAELFRRLS